MRPKDNRVPGEFLIHDPIARAVREHPDGAQDLTPRSVSAPVPGRGRGAGARCGAGR